MKNKTESIDATLTKSSNNLGRISCTIVLCFDSIEVECFFCVFSVNFIGSGDQKK